MKIEEMQKKIKGCVLLFNLDFSNSDPNFQYFSGYDDIGFLVLRKKGKPLLFLPAMDYAKFQNRRVKKIKLGKTSKAFEQMKPYLRCKSIGIDFGSINLKLKKALGKQFKARYYDVSSVCAELRKEKTKEEVVFLKKACKVSDEVMQLLIRKLKSGKVKTEIEAARFLEIETIRRGCKLSFPSIVASGKGAAIPHYKPSNVKFRKGFCVIDYGASYNGYKADMTRTVYFGKPSAKEEEIYAMLLRSQVETIESICKGDTAGDIHGRCVDLLGRYRKYFVHGLGHGIGLNIHELPSLVEKSKDVIKEGSVFTVEPGVYFKGKMGIRIEDDVMIEKGKVKVLTKTSKRLVVI